MFRLKEGGKRRDNLSTEMKVISHTERTQNLCTLNCVMKLIVFPACFSSSTYAFARQKNGICEAVSCSSAAIAPSQLPAKAQWLTGWPSLGLAGKKKSIAHKELS